METIKNTDIPNTRLRNSWFIILTGEPVSLSWQLSDLDRIAQKYHLTDYLLVQNRLTEFNDSN